MGLLTWKNSPEGRILISDVKIAKNYLTEKEIKKLERAISAFFDYTEYILVVFSSLKPGFTTFIEYSL